MQVDTPNGVGVLVQCDSTCFDAGSLVISEQYPSRELFNTKMIE